MTDDSRQKQKHIKFCTLDNQASIDTKKAWLAPRSRFIIRVVHRGECPAGSNKVQGAGTCSLFAESFIALVVLGLRCGY